MDRIRLSVEMRRWGRGWSKMRSNQNQIREGLRPQEPKAMDKSTIEAENGRHKQKEHRINKAGAYQR